MPSIEELERGLRLPEDAALGAPHLGAIRARGRRLRARRRLAVGGGGLAVAACVATAALVVPGALSGGASPVDEDGTEFAGAPRSDEQLLTKCRNGNVSDETAARLFDPGAPVVESVVRTRHQVRLALESADGRYWADCFVNLDSQEFASGMTVYPIGGRGALLQYGTGPACGLVKGDVDPSCSSFTVSWVDRRPAQVASAEVVTADGRTTTVPSRNGYLVLNYIGDMPDGTSMADGLPQDFQPIRSITFVDADGNPIAAQALDGSGTGEDHEKVGDLPTLDAYPGTYGDGLY